jgi:NHL repeat
MSHNPAVLKMFLLACTTALLLAACGGDEPAPVNPAPVNPAPVTSAPVTPTPPTPPPATPTIAFATVDTIAGQVNVRGSKDGKGSEATFNYPVGLAATKAAGATNNEVLLYIAGLTENIRYAQVGYADNPVGTAIGLGSSGTLDGDASTALVRAPQGIAVGYDNDAYEAYAYWTEDEPCLVRKLTRYPLNGNRKAVTVAGVKGQCGAADGSALSAKFNRPHGIVANTRTGEVFVADTGNYTIRRIYGDSVSTIAGAATKFGSTDGTGAAARFTAPNGLAMDRAENLYVTDYRTVRKVTPAGVVTTLAGSKAGEGGYKDGAAADARFERLLGIAIDENGVVYVADSGNHCIRQILPGGTVSTVAGVQSAPGAADGKIAAATFNTPSGMAYFNKQLFVSDSDSQTIRRIR